MAAQKSCLQAALDSGHRQSCYNCAWPVLSVKCAVFFLLLLLRRCFSSLFTSEDFARWRGAFYERLKQHVTAASESIGEPAFPLGAVTQPAPSQLSLFASSLCVKATQHFLQGRMLLSSCFAVTAAWGRVHRVASCACGITFSYGIVSNASA